MQKKRLFDKGVVPDIGVIYVGRGLGYDETDLFNEYLLPKSVQAIECYWAFGSTALSQKYSIAVLELS